MYQQTVFWYKLMRIYFVRPVAYAALSDVAKSDWDEANSVVQKVEEDEDTELVEEAAGKESSGI